MVVTGAARGIGEKVARVVAARGARVALIGVEPDRLRALADDLGPARRGGRPMCATVLLASAIDGCAETMGGIDFVVANAGVVSYGTVRQVDEASFERVVDINLNGVFRTLKYATPASSSQSRSCDRRGVGGVVHTAGRYGLVRRKQGRRRDARLGVRQEVAHLGITVGLVHPSWIGTDLVRGAEADIPSFQDLRRRLPYPGNVTTSVDRAAGAIVDGLVRRRSRVYVPRAVVVANWAKAALNSPAAWPWMRRFAAQVVPVLESECEALGRHDQLVPDCRRQPHLRDHIVLHVRLISASPRNRVVGARSRFV